MEILLATAIGWFTAVAVYLVLRRRVFPVILGMTMLSYAVNVFLFATGGLVVGAPPLLEGKVAGPGPMTDPLPQALVLTAIVISFGMTAVVVMMSLGAWFQSGSDRVDLDEAEPAAEAPQPEGRA
ncbi:Na+/H+ antiporter subunit C [Paracoccus suum]|uniref:Na+/H+ antiporter subunit C n=1 Tax=Paracoccus suum TaxID=2259340 RepID=A0A344PLV3_9RHOB|nr:Na+/H+ antiporter subunit C [Paracoccus suum]AXC50358.1 Na+/H+ antiporter subunit C [Paracoccus suum]